jgi:formamidopyrimidine-DNA glycosylase
MPELPDIVVYIEALEKRILGQTLEHARVANPFLVRTFDPPLSAVEGKTVRELRRIGKRIALGFEGDLWLVIHLMIAGRLHWKDRGAKTGGKNSLAAFDFPTGTLTLTEAGTKRRASIHVVAGESGLADLDPGGLEVLGADVDTFSRLLTASNHTLKRALTDPRTFSGIGNAYSDEILWEAQLSPILLTQKMTPEQISRLFDAIKSTMAMWVERLRQDAGDGFPEKVTAFRKDMAVHGRYADNETNYCPTCQTGGKLLADRALSRLLGKDWPKTLDELELLTKKHGG